MRDETKNALELLKIALDLLESAVMSNIYKDLIRRSIKQAIKLITQPKGAK